MDSNIHGIKEYKDIRVLILEDSPADAELLEDELRQAGLAMHSKRVEDRQAYIKALQGFSPHIILSDYDLPAFSGAEALQIRKEKVPEVPFILVTGALGEERAIEMLTGGATDYVLKKNLSRLIPAVRRALHEAYEHKKRKDAEAERDSLLKELELRVQKRTRDLQAEIDYRKRTEEALRESEGIYRTLFNDSPFPLVEVDASRMKTYVDDLLAERAIPELRTYFKKHPDELLNSLSLVTITEANKAAMDLFGVKDKDLFMQAMFKTINENNHYLLEDALLAAAEHTYSYETETSLETLAGKTIFVRLKWVVPPEYKDTSARVLLSFIDLTDRRRIEEELESFSYSVAHDLRAPLRAIDGFSRMLLNSEQQLDQETNRKLQIIRENAVKMDRLINDLLYLSKSGRTPISSTRIDMDRLVKELWQEQLSASPDRKMELKRERLPKAFGDEALIRQVLSNLLANAVKFSRRKKLAMIEIGGKSSGNENIYYIKDNGTGFDMQYHDRLFGVFQRLHSENDYEGTGVGLAIVQRIIHRHGGRIWAEGKVGRGAAFYFTLPEAGFQPILK